MELTNLTKQESIEGAKGAEGDLLIALKAALGLLHEVERLGDGDLVSDNPGVLLLARMAIAKRESTGSGAAVSASPQPNLYQLFKHKSDCPWNTTLPTGEGTWGCNCDLGKLLLELEDCELALPASPGPRPVCPKCFGPMENEIYAIGEDCESTTTYEITCTKNRHVFTIPYPCGLKDFVQFFPVSLNGEKRAPDKFSQKWSQDAFVILAGLKESVSWELAPEIMKEINRLVEELLATTQGTPEGK